MTSLKLRYEERLNWFKSQIGKVIFRTKTTCKCTVCADVYERGLVVTDEFHACYLMDCESEMGIHYFETIEERNEFEKNNLKQN